MISWLSPRSVPSIIVATSFAAGLNVYAVILTVGLLSRFGGAALPPSLHDLESWWVIGASGVLFLVEFFGDKVPAFDLLWNALHTFIRVPVAALLSYFAADQLPPETRLLCTLAGGLIALAAHSGKTALRAVVLPSPEPFSNIILSAAEDAAAIGLTWLATKHPYLAAQIALVGVLLIVVLVRFVFRALRELLGHAEGVLEG